MRQEEKGVCSVCVGMGGGGGGVERESKLKQYPTRGMLLMNVNVEGAAV